MRMRDKRLSRLLVGAILVVVLVVTFLPTLGLSFVTWDDDVNIYENPYLKPPTWDGIARFWREPYEGLYAPLTYTVWAGISALTYKPADGAQKGNLEPQPFHLCNLIVHILNVLLVFAILCVIFDKLVPGVRTELPASVGAMLFGLHPLQVEPIAWATGLKDLLSAGLGLCALLLYLGYSAASEWHGARRRVISYYAFGLLALILALLAKPTAAVIPLMAMILETLIAKQSMRRAMVGLLPWLVVSVAAIAFAKIIQTGEHMRFVSPIWSRLFIAGDALAFYIAKVVYPINLATDYGRSPEYVLGKWWLFITWLVPACLTLLMVRRGGRVLLIAWILCVVGVLPVLGFVPFVFQSYSTVADRYMYLSMIGPSLALAWTIASSRKVAVLYACFTALLAVAVVSNVQSRYWKNTTALFEHTLRVNSSSPVAYYNMGMECVSQNRLDEAIEQFKRAIIMRPDYAKAHNNLGVALAGRGDVMEGIEHLQEAVSIKPDYAVAHYNLGIALLSQNDTEGALEHLSEAVRIFPDHLEAQLSLGKLLARIGMSEKAASHFEQVVRIDPKHAEGHLCLGMVLARLRMIDKAVGELKKAIQLRPDYAEAHNNLAVMLYLQGKYRDAYAEVQICKRLGANPDPHFIKALSEKLNRSSGGTEQ